MPWRICFKSNKEYNAWYRKYRLKNLKKIQAYNRKYNRQWRQENGFEAEKRWATKNPDKVKAIQKLNKAVRSGKIKKKPCEKCGNKKSVAHHPDYSMPLFVWWVCRSCHRKIHYGDKGY